MMRAPILTVVAALAICAPMAARAEVDEGLLPVPPANAKAGECFAKVVVPGRPIYGPPTAPHARWVQGAPQPGAPGPGWVQVCELGAPSIVGALPERAGWIRVICDHDRTREKINHVQRRLHDWGVYSGAFSGEFDTATAEAVQRFQSERHIEHGGYLSFRTLEALDAPPTPADQTTAAPRTIYTAPVYAPVQMVYRPQREVAQADGRRWLIWPGKTAY